jgi:hypothetical protein
MSRKPDPEVAAAEAVAQELLTEDKPRVHQLDVVDALRKMTASTQLTRLQMATETLLRMDGAARHARIAVDAARYHGKHGGRPKKALDPDVLRMVRERLPLGEIPEDKLLKRLRRNSSLKPLTDYMLRKYIAAAQKKKISK